MVWVLESRLSRNQRLFGSCVIWDQNWEDWTDFYSAWLQTVLATQVFGRRVGLDSRWLEKERSSDHCKGSKLKWWKRLTRRWAQDHGYWQVFNSFHSNSIQHISYLGPISGDSVIFERWASKPSDRVQIERKPTINFHLMTPSHSNTVSQYK